MKETYLNINEECDAIDELCVICLEFEDEFKIRTIIHTKLLKCQCECKYYIHKSCFDKWLNKRPNSNLTCLICSSTAKPVLSYKDCCVKILNSRRLKTCCKEFSKLIQWSLCLTFIWLLLIEIENLNNNYHE